jgi:HEAT repeat protein
VALVLTLVVVLGHPVCLALPASHQRDVPDADVRMLIHDLSTARRATAKTRLLEIGVKAAPQLIATLRELTQFAQESLAVTDWAVMEDCVELLGKMKSEEAVPAIIEALEIRMPSGREPKPLAEIRALEEIGPPAVPALVDALTRAPETARKQKSLYYPGERLIQIRMAFALAEIGDPRAIPALEDLIKTQPSFGSGFVADAVAKMRLKKQPQ